MKIDGSTHMPRVHEHQSYKRPEHLRDRHENGQPKPKPSLSAVDSKHPQVPTAGAGSKADRSHDRFDEMGGLDYRMRLKLAAQSHGEDKEISFRMKLKAKLHGRIDDFSVKMKQDFKASFKLEAEGEQDAEALQASFKMKLKMHVNGNLEGGDAAGAMADMNQAFGAAFQGFIDSLGSLFGGGPTTGQLPTNEGPDVVDIPAVVTDSADPKDAPIATQVGAAAGSQQPETVPVETPVDVDDVVPVEADDVVPAEVPAEETTVSPFEGFLNRIGSLFESLTQEITNLLGSLQDPFEGIGTGAGDRPANTSFQARISFKFDVHLRYEQASLPAPEPVLNLEA